MPRLFYLLCTASLLGMASNTIHTERPVHVFIFSGQSNMSAMDPRRGFLSEAQRLFPNAEIEYLHVAQSGAPIRLWIDEWNLIAARHGVKQRMGNGARRNYRQILSQYRRILQEHPHPASVTFCWMQGERDATEKISKTYREALTQLISNLRRDLKQPDLNVVIGRISDHGARSIDWQTIRRDQVSVATQDSRGAWIDCDDLNDKRNNHGFRINDLHYTQAGYATLGRRFAHQAAKLIAGKPPATDGRPTRDAVVTAKN